jgi:hypothetical protein
VLPRNFGQAVGFFGLLMGAFGIFVKETRRIFQPFLMADMVNDDGFVASFVSMACS